jgi:hypothetical protein
VAGAQPPSLSAASFVVLTVPFSVLFQNSCLFLDGPIKVAEETFCKLLFHKSIAQLI